MSKKCTSDKSVGVQRVHLSSDVRELLTQIHTWSDFCKLPSEVKEKYLKPDNQIDPGYKPRHKDGVFVGEIFDVWSYVEKGTDLLKSEVIWNANEDERDFFLYANNVHEVTRVYIEKMLHPLLKNTSCPVKIDQFKILTRFIHYAPQQHGYVYTDHTDRGFLSLHIYESEPGFMYYDTVLEKWQSIVSYAHEGLIFGGKQAKEFCSRDIEPVRHRIIAQPNGNERFSVVAFAWLPQTD